MQPLRRNLRFQVFWVGSAASELGSTLSGLAFPLLVLAMTGSPTQAGLVGAVAMGTEILVGLPAGALVDRWDRRRILLGADLVRIVTMAGVGGALLAGALTMPHLLAVAVVNGVASALFRPAHGASLRALVPPEQLPTAYAQEQTRQHAAGLAGPALGGALFALGRAVPFLVDAATYLVSFVCVAFARVPRRPETPPAPAQSMRADIAEAVRWMWDQPLLRAVCGLVLGCNLVVNAMTIPIIVLVGDPVDVGVVMAALGLGGLAGAALSARLMRLLPTGRLMLAGSWLFALVLPLLVLPLGAYWTAGVLFVAMLVVPALNIALEVEIARSVPDHMQGRVHGALNVMFSGLTPLAPLLGGLLSQHAGAAPAILVLCVGLVACTVTASFSRSLRAKGGLPVRETPVS
ncbi:MFS transporter [Nonomuraea sp. NPDC050328]|uniref:MFS transporter n=1 Tax=Nonomuraea sp. NPDC050328 TaxID=3364361 RepID=UPI0037B48EA1